LALPNEKPPFNGREEKGGFLLVLACLIGVSEPLRTSLSPTFLIKTVENTSTLGLYPGV